MIAASVVSPIAESIGLGIAQQGGCGNPILALFADGTDGFWFDSRNLYQTVAGSPSVSAADPVAVALDRHSWAAKPLLQVVASQPELTVNGTFDADTNWTKGAGVTISGGEVVWTAAGSSLGIIAQVNPLTTGKFYRAEVVVTSYTTGSLFVRFGSSNNVQLNVTGPGTYVAYGVADSAGLNLRSSGTTTLAATSFSVKEIPGNHGVQAAAAAQPKLQLDGATPLMRLDGNDDNLLTTLSPASAAGTLIGKVRATSSASNKIIIGAGPGTNGWCAVEIRSNGLVGGRVGAQTSTVITGGSDKHGALVVAALVYDATTVKLYADSVEIYSAARSGNPQTVDAFMLGAANNAGVGAGFFLGDIYHAIALKKALTPAQIASASTYLTAN